MFCLKKCTTAIKKTFSKLPAFIEMVLNSWCQINSSYFLRDQFVKRASGVGPAAVAAADNSRIRIEADKKIPSFQIVKKLILFITCLRWFCFLSCPRWRYPFESSLKYLWTRWWSCGEQGTQKILGLNPASSNLFQRHCRYKNLFSLSSIGYRILKWSKNIPLLPGQD